MLEKRILGVDWGKRKRRRNGVKGKGGKGRKEGRKEGGDIKRMVAAGKEEMCCIGSKRVWLFSIPGKKADLLFLLLLSSSLFNSRNLKDGGTPGQLCVSFFLEDKLKRGVQIKGCLVLLLDSCFIVFLCAHQPISVLLVS